MTETLHDLWDALLEALASGDADAADELEAEILAASGRSESRASEGGFTGDITDSAGHRRHYVDGKQVATAGGSGGGSGDHPAAAKDHLAELDRREAPASLVARVGNWVGRKYKGLAEEYGHAGAVSILVGMALMVPVPAPGSVLIPVALAKAVKRLARGRGDGRAAESAVSPDELLARAKELLAELYREHGEEPPPLDEEKAAAWLASQAG